MTLDIKFSMYFIGYQIPKVQQVSVKTYLKTHAACQMDSLYPKSTSQSVLFIMCSTMLTVFSLAVVTIVVTAELVSQHGAGENEKEQLNVKNIEEFDPIEQMKQLIEEEIREGEEFREDIKNSGKYLDDPWEIDEDLDVESLDNLFIPMQEIHDEL